MRPLSPPLQARHPKDGAGLMLPSGQITFPKPTDWLVIRNEQVIDVCDDAHLASGYQIIEEGTFLPKAVCVEMETITGLGSTRNPAELLKAVDRLARISIGGVKIEFTPGQLEEIKHRAGKRGLTVEKEIERIVDRIKDELFYRS